MKSAIKPLEIQLASGCAQAASEYASPPAPRTVTNLRLLQRGGLGKRPGARGLAGTTSNSTHRIKGNGTTTEVAAPTLVSQVGRSAVLGLTDGQLFGLDEVQGELFEHVGYSGTAVPIRRHVPFTGPLADTGFGPKPGAVAVNSSGYRITAAIDGGTGTGSVEVVIESPEGALLYRATKAVGSAQVRAHAVGTVLWLVWQETANIKAQSFTPGSTGTTVGSATTVGTLYDATYYWDTSAYDGTHWFMIHGSGSDTLRIDKFAGTTSAANATFATGAIVATPCSIWADSANAQVWVGYYDDPGVLGGVNYRVYAAAALASVKGETTLNNGTLYGPPLFGPLRHPTNKTDSTIGAFYCFRYVETSGNKTRGIYTGNAWSDSTSPSSPVLTSHVVPISKPDSRHRVWCVVENGASDFTISRVVLLRWVYEDGTPPVVDLTLPSMLAPGATYGPVNSSMFFHAVAVGTSNSYASVPTVLAIYETVPRIQPTVCEYSTAEQAPWRSVSRGFPSTAIAGSPCEIYGRSVPQGQASIRVEGAAEIGFVHGPTITASDTASGSSIPAGTYLYRAVYEWADLYGRRHRSEPSAPFTVTLTVARNVTLSITTIDATQRRGQNLSGVPRITLYRTVNGGTTYHRIVGEAIATSSDGIRTITDTALDATISDEEILYTDGGVLSNEIGPSCRYLARSEDAVWFGGLFDSNIVQRSKLIFPGEPIQCTDHPSHQVVLPGECTGLAYMDGQIAAFTRDSILLINSSSGPNDQGVGEFAPPRLHTTGLGCVDGRSVLETPEGIFFLSQRGIELLPRGFGTVQFVGEAIKDLQQTSLLDQCGFSAYQADKNGSYARFGLMTGSSEFSVPSVRYVATFDMNTAQWFIDDYGSETMGAMGAWPLGFALIRTDLDSDTSPTPIWYEDGSLVSQPETGGAAHIDSSIVVNRLWPFGHAGWGKIRRVQITFYSHVANWILSLTVQTDENTAQTVTWSVTSTGLQWRQLSVIDDECSSIKITISDTDSVVFGAKQAATYLMCALESEAHDGLRLLASGDKQ